MSININLKIQKKDLYLLAAIMVFLVGVAYVIAGIGDNYQIHGHPAEEINLPDCANDEILKKTSSGWECDSSGGYTQFTVVAGAWSFPGPATNPSCPGGYDELAVFQDRAGDMYVDWRTLKLCGQ